MLVVVPDGLHEIPTILKDATAKCALRTARLYIDEMTVS